MTRRGEAFSATAAIHSVRLRQVIYANNVAYCMRSDDAAFSTHRIQSPASLAAVATAAAAAAARITRLRVIRLSTLAARCK